MLALTLARGAAGSLFKRGPYDDARLPSDRLVLPGVRVDAGRLAAYARVCGFPPDTGTLPVTYPHLLGFPGATRLMARRSFPFPLLGLVHTGVEIVQHRALRTEDTPEIRVWAEGLRAHRRGSEFDMLTSAWVAGEETWWSRSTYLCRHRPAGGSPERTSGADASGTDSGTGRDDAADADTPLPVRAHWRLPGDLGRRYGAVSGDRNPIHLHPVTARAFGFPSAIAHGMWSVARCLAEQAEQAAGSDGDSARPSDRPAGRTAERVSVGARFRAPVPLPGSVTYGERDGAFELRGGSAERPRTHLTGWVSSEPR
ncbi:MaoC/PaaZ C-terminal domain-containing protein [Streptomyces oceani]|uniref:MaoC-like domain-containing protein n=1 Tax=Streptomyces oceani TaxID=1075402 RepID=A0A1E7KHJ0_9ACTN|nr:MaoC/PaaZ C-terminal domain-containing protein [Streptomyces oceani]OEV03336.1 hypothetical protein AN216_12415 [Streptomyces oceani]